MSVADLKERMGPEDHTYDKQLSYYGVSPNEWGFMFYYHTAEYLLFDIENDHITKISICNFYGD